MTTADDQFRDYFRTVTPKEFPPCPVPETAVSSSFAAAESQRGTRLSRIVLALAASILLVLGLSVLPSAGSKPVNGEAGILKDATANGKAIQPKEKKR